MKRSVIKVLMIVLLITTLLFLVSCKGKPAAGEGPYDTATAARLVTTGSQGVELSLMQGFPPPFIYDEDELVAILEVKNRGNFDLALQSCRIHVTGFDKTILTTLSPYGGRRCAEGITVLEGKNLYNVQGGINQLEFKSTSNRLPEKVFEYNPVLNFLTCYHYHTSASPLVCVDPLFYDVSTEQKTCVPTDVGMGGGQGAPVAVSHVGVDMVGGRAVFEITIQNVGGGTILAPGISPEACVGKIAYTQLDLVEYVVKNTGLSSMRCKPRDKVRLSNGMGKIVCDANIPPGSAFQTPLQITLDYNYMDSLTQPIRIIKTPSPG